MYFIKKNNSQWRSSAAKNGGQFFLNEKQIKKNQKRCFGDIQCGTTKCINKSVQCTVFQEKNYANQYKIWQF